jgi:dienelactone hydrolase
MNICEDCVKGVLQQGTPEGKITNVNGVECYVAKPTGDYPKDKALLFLSDVFGIHLVNTQLLADGFARNGYLTYVPDVLNGDFIPESVLTPEGRAAFDADAWKARHGRESCRPPIDKVMAALKEGGVVHFGASGYCFGARYVFDLAFEKAIKVSIVSHPSMLECPADLEKYAANSEAPLLVNSCTVDPEFPHEAQAQADEILGGGKFAPGYKREYFEGCTHGFTVRGDMRDPKVKAGMEGSFTSTVHWLNKYL